MGSEYSDCSLLWGSTTAYVLDTVVLCKASTYFKTHIRDVIEAGGKREVDVSGMQTAFPREESLVNWLKLVCIDDHDALVVALDEQEKGKLFMELARTCHALGAELLSKLLDARIVKAVAALPLALFGDVGTRPAVTTSDQYMGGKRALANALFLAAPPKIPICPGSLSVTSYGYAEHKFWKYKRAMLAQSLAEALLRALAYFRMRQQSAPEEAIFKILAEHCCAFDPLALIRSEQLQLADWQRLARILALARF